MPLLDTARGLQDVLDEKGIGRKDLVRSPGEKIELRSSAVTALPIGHANDLTQSANFIYSAHPTEPPP